MKRVILAMAAAVFLLLGVSAPTAVADDCQPDSWCCITYRDSAIVNFSGYGDCCAGYGNGCTECVDTGTGDSCITNGTYCSPRHPLNRV